MKKPTDDHHTQNTSTGAVEPYDAFDLEHLCPGSNPGPDLDAPELAPATDPLAQRFFTLSQAGKIFGKTPRTMRWWADTGRVRTVKIGAARFITEAEIERLQRGGEG
ncbi:MAG: helix-turn-helix domain-containing protein [Acidocella sp.]|nr:helix-turn-helix domain-containing protein [Acidocella sp.]